MLGFLSSLGLGSLGSMASGLGTSLASGLGEGFLGKAALAGGSGLLSFLGNNFTGRQTRSDQARLAYELAAYQAHLEHKYKQIYDQENYELAQNYSENSAKWAVTGLKNAGLNPILAASGGFSANMGQPSNGPSVSADASQTPNPGSLDVAEVLRDIASLDLSRASAKQLSTQSSVNLANEDLIKANSAKVGAEIDKIKAEADSVRNSADISSMQALQDFIRGGDKSLVGTILGSSAQSSDANRPYSQALYRVARRLASRFGEPSDYSAKSSSDGALRKVERVIESHPVRHSAKRSYTRRLMDNMLYSPANLRLR